MMLRVVRRFARPVPYINFPIVSSLSTQVFTSQLVNQGGELHCDFSEVENCTLNITSKWRDDCEVTYEDEVDMNIKITEHHESNYMSVKGSNFKSQTDCVVNISVPEYMDINVNANHLNLNIVNKVQGDVSISCRSGNIVADKLRGELLTFTCGDADLTVKKLLEGCSVIQCRSLQAKMINGDASEISAAVVSVDALYCAQARIEAADNITVGLSRGALEATSLHGNVSVSNIDGSFDLLAQHGSVKVQVNQLVHHPAHSDGQHRQQLGSSTSGDSGVVSAEGKVSRGDQVGVTDSMDRGLMHRLQHHHSSNNHDNDSADSNDDPKYGVEHTVDASSPRLFGSRASAPKGHITAVVDPELEASIYCHSDSGGLQRMTVTLNSDGFELDPSNNSNNNSSSSSISSEGEEEVRTPRAGTWQGSCVAGTLTGRAAGVKRPTFSGSNTRSGKINLTGAEAQALESGGVSLQDTRSHSTSSNINAEAGDGDHLTGSISSSTSSSGESNSNNTSSRDHNRSSSRGAYDLTFVARGNVRVETMSWIQVIRSKYGFEDTPGASPTGTPPPSNVGRTASASTVAAELARASMEGPGDKL